MADEPENLTIRLLQEMRNEMRTMREDLTEKIDGLSQHVDDLVQRVDGNTLVFNLVAGVVHDHERRIEALESPAE